MRKPHDMVAKEMRQEKASSKGSAASAEADEKIRQEKKREEMRQEKASSKGSATSAEADEKIRQEKKREEMR